MTTRRDAVAPFPSVSTLQGDQHSRARRSSAHRHLTELDGVRGIALAGVVLFHLWGRGRVSGGIDVFLAISGLLYTGSLLREASRTGRVAIVPYLAKLALRLLPPMVVVVVVVATFGWFVRPADYRPQMLAEARASLLYVENWQLIGSQLGYEAAGVQTSLFQHLWSLSVQGQFYLVWPVVAVLAVWLARRLGRSPDVVMARVLVGIAAASAVFAVLLSRREQDVAYLHSGTRLWEFAFGGLILLMALPTRHRLPERVQLVVGWIGLAAMVATGFLWDGRAQFPGPAALWPMTALALTLLGGRPEIRGGVGRVMVGRPVSWMADRSYALYLWHWPVLLIGLQWLRREQAGWWGLVVLAASLLLADLTFRYVEAPARSARRAFGSRPRHPGRLLGVALVSLALCVGVIGAGQGALERQEATDAAQIRASLAQSTATGTLGAGATVRAVSSDPDDWMPKLAWASRDRPDLGVPLDECVQSFKDTEEASEVLVCRDPFVTHPTRTIVLTGGSHAEQWYPALRAIADRENWAIVIILKSGCQLTSNTGQFPEPRDRVDGASCQDWNARAVQVIAEQKPDAVVTIATTTRSHTEQAPLGFRDQWHTLDELGAPVIAIRDTTRLKRPAPECLALGGTPESCGVQRSAMLEETFPYDIASERVEAPASTRFVDLTDRICTATFCPAVVGDVIVYRDHSHLTATYARTLVPFLDAELRRVRPDLYSG